MPSSLRNPRILGAVAVVGAALLAIAVVLLVRQGGGDSSTAVVVEPTSPATAAPTKTPAPTPTVTPNPSPLDRMVIPTIGVDAPLSVKGIDADGVMQSPNGPEDVAWYDISTKPGTNGNAVFSGHVNYHNYGPAVFARLQDLSPGDAIEIRLADGTVYRYRVTSADTVPANIDANQILAPTGGETITLVTCTGTWDGSEYDSRLVVRAARVP